MAASRGEGVELLRIHVSGQETERQWGGELGLHGGVVEATGVRVARVETQTSSVRAEEQAVATGTEQKGTFDYSSPLLLRDTW